MIVFMIICQNLKFRLQTQPPVSQIANFFYSVRNNCYECYLFQYNISSFQIETAYFLSNKKTKTAYFLTHKKTKARSKPSKEEPIYCSMDIKEKISSTSDRGKTNLCS